MFNFKRKSTYKIDKYYGRLLIIVIGLLVTLIVVILVRDEKEELPIFDFDNDLYLISSKYNREVKKEYDEVETHVSLEVLDQGYNIYAPNSGQAGYQYGPSILINEDGSLDAWFSTPGNNSSEWDWIVYRHSDDGLNWSKDKVVLQPTGDSMDHYSVCDPGVIYFDGYYYLGYTSTLVSTDNGINNNVFVARSKNPDGPFEKWDGEGWGGNPKPIVYYNESNDFWGAGEISFVVVDDTLYCYYSWHCEHGSYTRVSTAPLSENWPSELKYEGVATVYRNGQDSCDVFYIEDTQKFVSVAIAYRFTENSGIIVSESDDGIDFDRSDFIYTNVAKYAHNMGITKHLNGHVKSDEDLAIAYAYSSRKNSTGIWATRFQPISLIVYESKKPIEQDKDGSPVLYNDYYSNKQNNYVIGIGASPRTINMSINETKNVNPLLYKRTRSKSSIDNVTYEYDENIIQMKGNKIIPVSVGQTIVTMYYDEYYSTFKVIVHDENYYNDPKSDYIVRFEPVEENIVLHLNDDNYHSVQIRSYVEFKNGKWTEGFNDYTYKHPKYPSNFPAEEYLIKYEAKDDDIVYVSNEGIIEPKKIGTTTIKVELYDDVYYEISVTVTD